MTLLSRLPGRVGLAGCCFLTLISTAHPTGAAPLLAVSLPLTNPLEQLLSGFLQQFQTVTDTVNQQVSQVVGPLQQDVAEAIATTFGPTSLDVHQAETDLLSALRRSGPSIDGINPVVAHQGTVADVLTRTVVAANQSVQSQTFTRKMLEDTQATLQHIKDCAQTGQSAQATQDVLKSLLCQQQGIASLNASLIPLAQKTVDANTAVAVNLQAVNEQLTGQAMAALRSQQSAIALKRSIYTQLHFLGAPPGTQVLKLPAR